MAAGICREKNCLPRAVYSNYLELLKALMRKGVPKPANYFFVITKLLFVNL